MADLAKTVSCLITSLWHINKGATPKLLHFLLYTFNEMSIPRKKKKLELTSLITFKASPSTIISKKTAYKAVNSLAV
jgi:hypothetical protein